MEAKKVSHFVKEIFNFMARGLPKTYAGLLVICFILGPSVWGWELSLLIILSVVLYILGLFDTYYAYQWALSALLPPLLCFSLAFYMARDYPSLSAYRSYISTHGLFYILLLLSAIFAYLKILIRLFPKLYFVKPPDRHIEVTAIEKMNPTFFIEFITLFGVFVCIQNDWFTRFIPLFMGVLFLMFLETPKQSVRSLGISLFFDVYDIQSSGRNYTLITKKSSHLAGEIHHQGEFLDAPLFQGHLEDYKKWVKEKTRCSFSKTIGNFHPIFVKNEEGKAVAISLTMKEGTSRERKEYHQQVLHFLYSYILQNEISHKHHFIQG